MKAERRRNFQAEVFVKHQDECSGSRSLPYGKAPNCIYIYFGIGLYVKL